MNREPTQRVRQALPGRKQFLSALGTGAGLACAAGLPVASRGAESTPALSKRALLEVLAAAGKPAHALLDLSLLRRSFDADPISPRQPQAAYYVTRNLATMLDGLEPGELHYSLEGAPPNLEAFALKSPQHARPFIAHAGLDLAGPVTATLRLRAKQAGQGTRSWRTKEHQDFLPDNQATLAWSASAEPQIVQTQLPVAGRLIHVRLQPSVASGLEILSITLRSRDGQEQAWTFAP